MPQAHIIFPLLFKVIPTPVLSIFPGTPGSFYWRMLFTNQDLSTEYRKKSTQIRPIDFSHMQKQLSGETIVFSRSDVGTIDHAKKKNVNFKLKLTSLAKIN